MLFTRPLWLDEWHVALVANRPSLTQVVSDLQQGSDFAPPLLHVMLWFLRHVVDVAPVPLRLFSATFGFGAVALVFLTLRRRLSSSAAAAGALALLGHSLVVEQIFQWRFYAPWLFFAALVAWALSLDHGGPSRRRDVTLAIGAICLCTIHWFGVISLGLMCLGALATYGRWWRSRLRLVLPAAAGVVALALCIPLVLGQRGAIEGTSWMPDPDLRQVVALVRYYWLAAIPLLAALMIGVALSMRRTRDMLREAVAALQGSPGIAALVSLALFPVAMAVVSLRQPALLPRYSFVAFLAWAPLVAIATHSLGRAGRALIAVFALLVAGSFLRVEHTYGEYARGMADGMASVRQACTMNLPVFFQSRHTMYGVTGTKPACDARLFAMADETRERVLANQMMRNSFAIETEFARLHERLYGFPRVVPQTQLDSLPRFLVVESDPLLPSPYREQFLAAVFPRHTITRIGPALMLAARN